MKKILLLAIMVFILFLLPQVGAHVFVLSSDKTVYEPGDVILINLKVKNTLSVEKNFNIYINLKEENDSYPPYAKSYIVDLMPDETKNITVYSSNVSEYLVNGYYTLQATLLQDGFALYEDEISFSIIGLPEVMKASILLSNSSSYYPPKDVFLLNKRVYIGYNSSVEDVEVEGVLKYPSNDTRNIVLPYDFKPNEIGIYSLTIDAKKEGYRGVEERIQFAVIEHQLFTDEKKEGEKETPGFELIVLFLAVALLFLKRKRTR